MFYNIVSSVSAVNIAVVVKFALEVFINMCIAICQGRGVVINTVKFWGLDSYIPYSVGTC